MKDRTLRSMINLVFALAGLVSTAFGQEAQFFRVVSTQPMGIVSTDREGVLSWVNSTSDAPCWIEVCSGINGNWTTNFPSTRLQDSGLFARARVPLFAVAGEIIVGYQDDVSEGKASSLMESYGLVWVSNFPRLFAYWVKVLTGTPADYLPSLESSELVLWAKQRGKPFGEEGVPYILVQFNIRATPESARQLIASFPDLQLDSMVVAPKSGLVYVPAGSEERWISQFETNPEVRYADLNRIMTIY